MQTPELKIPFCWEKRRPCLLDHFLYVPSFYDKHEAWTPIAWEALFENDHHVCLEYCSGNGQWICERAKLHPEFNWIALDLRFDRCRKTWARLHKEKIPNLYVLCGDARILTRWYIPKKSIAQFFINFPDPWPKRHHAKNRLIQAPFLADMSEVAIQGATATFVTDDFPYLQQMLKELQNPNWRPQLSAPHYSVNIPDYGYSFFADLWQKKRKRYLLDEL